MDISPDYQLAVSFDLDNGTLTGTARIMLDAGESVTLDTGSLTITGLLLKRQDASERQPPLIPGPSLTVPAGSTPQELFVSYTFRPEDDGRNLIAPEGITLLSGWYPQPADKRRYQLSASLPAGFTGISESAVYPLPGNGDTVSAAFPQPLAAIHFLAARYDAASLPVREGLLVHTLFFPEDRGLAHDYLEKAREYILRYEREIGPFPYNHYAVVANRLPTGLGMPTFTLLGQSVLRLPFIKDTSLGHEVLHSWFGNSVEVDPTSGNWCEGLTSYLADQAFRADLGEGASYRKEAILNYLSYVHEQNVIPLASFRDAGHSQPQARARRAVGYSRAMLLFHELQQRLGADRFRQGIRYFYASHRDGSASWDDLRASFEHEAAGEDLDRFFTERLDRTDIPAFRAEDVSVLQNENGNILKFQLIQETEAPYSLRLPVKVTTAGGEHRFTVDSDQEKTEVRLPLPARPFSLTLDPEYSLLRTLSPAENPPVWSKYMGSEEQLVIVRSREEENLYRPLLQTLAGSGENIKYGDEVGNMELAGADLLLVGLDQPAVRTLFASPNHPGDGFTLEVRANPLNPDHVAVLVSSAGVEETEAATSRLSHYGKYGYLHFRQGRIKETVVPETADGLHYPLEQLPAGGATAQLDPFAAIVEELADRDVVYLGETHTSAADHRLQLRLLEAIAARVEDLAIGMEMFPATSQPALDDYLLGDGTMSEKEFLKASRYFEVWQFDFRYFREIFALAKRKRIPVIGLNLEREIVSTVYRTGGTDELTDEVRKALPQQRDLDLQGYGERLQLMHALHEQGGHGNGMASGFIQAQALWDETMAENIASHLRSHPGRKMVVLAGNQHTRKDSGIPPRLARRMEVRQATVINVADEAAPENLPEVADYFFISEPLPAEAPPKMGIMLKEQTDPGGQHLEVIDFSPESKAPEAGLEKGDRLLSVAGTPIATMADVRIAMLDAEAEEAVPVRVERNSGTATTTHVFTVPLIRIAPAKPHP